MSCIVCRSRYWDYNGKEDRITVHRGYIVVVGRTTNKKPKRKIISHIVTCYKEKRVGNWPVVLVMGCLRLKRLHFNWDLNDKKIWKKHVPGGGNSHAEAVSWVHKLGVLEKQEGQCSWSRVKVGDNAEVGLCLILQSLVGHSNFDCGLNAMGSHWKVLSKERFWTDTYLKNFILVTGWKMDTRGIRWEAGDQLVERCQVWWA